MKLSLSIILVFFSLLANANYQIGGLREEAALRYMGYQHMPATRDKFNNFGSYTRYKVTQKNIIRTRLNPRLNLLRETVKKYSQIKVLNMMEYDPTLKISHLTAKNPLKLAFFNYPSNISFTLPYSGGRRDLESIIFTLKEAPDGVQFLTLLQEIESIFAKEINYKPKKYKNKKEAQLYESLKEKNYEFYQYEPHFAFFLGHRLLVDSEYLKDLNGVLNTTYIRLFRSFKARYFTANNEIKDLVSRKVVVDVQTIIEKVKYKNLAEPFRIAKSKVPKGLVRFEGKLNEVNIFLLIGVNEERLNPKNSRMLNDFFIKAIQ